MSDLAAGELVLAPSAARTAAFTGEAIPIKGYNSLLIELNSTAASGTSPTLDVKVQTRVGPNGSWADIGAFAQVTGVTKRIMRISRLATPDTEEGALTDGTLAAGTVQQGPLGDQLRIKHAAPGGTNPSFTYACRAWAAE